MAFCFRSLVLLGLLGQIALAHATDPRSFTVNAEDARRTSLRFRVQENETPRSPREIEYQTRQSYTVRHVQYFPLAGQLAYAGLNLPYHRIEQDFKNSRRRGDDQTGMGDPMLAFGLGLYRMPALSREALRSYDDDGFSSGCQFHISVPLGSYQGMRASNPGGNRWMLIPECQIGWNHGDWLLEGLASFNWFSTNHDYRGTSFSQDTQYNFKLITTYGSQRTMYGGLTLEYRTGGATSRAGRSDDNALNNWIGGAMFYFKLAPEVNLKLIGELPLKTEAGSTKSSELSAVITYNW
ncbi:transporter [Chitinibacter fontanus]|uniref:Transporter n=1 Tax=Chitinibacter fontanus TaxID=1737446 RepID=A0A7D5ZE74_9NEIS|nr:transporter [Chitinibacter fontanus]QLI82385.1 transporter [Chitinibacter fontanus]